ncbi:MAG: FTR1 family protein [Proteobacteria bacterium]|nr:FTR1 family protein [Pseudomonadota bacterium]
MLATAIILFREVLEASLIIAIILGASKTIPNRGKWVAAGIGIGLAGASLVALFADQISSAFSGNGQPLFNSSILLLAVSMLGWHSIWMSQHSKKMTENIQVLGNNIQKGTKPPFALMIITLIAVMREGSEAVLFLWAISTGGAQYNTMITGGILGVMAGILSGILLYKGLLRLPIRHFFSITNAFILLLTAGLAAQAAGFLNQAGIVPSLGNQIWNSSRFLSQTSIPGQLMHILIGYTARPMGIQIVFYLLTLFILFSLTHLIKIHKNKT